jgi:hypothetical protein
MVYITSVRSETSAAIIPWDVLAEVVRLQVYTNDAVGYSTIFDMFTRRWFFDRTCLIYFSDEVGASTEALWNFMKLAFERYAGKIALTECLPLMKHVRSINPHKTLRILDLKEYRLDDDVELGLHRSKHVISATYAYADPFSFTRSLPKGLANFDARYWRTIDKAYPSRHVSPRIHCEDDQLKAVWVEDSTQQIKAILYPIPEGELDAVCR